MAATRLNLLVLQVIFLHDIGDALLAQFFSLMNVTHYIRLVLNLCQLPGFAGTGANV